MRLQVRLFALAREKVGATEVEWTVSAPARVADLWASLVDAHPGLAPLEGSVSFAVNQEYVGRDHALSDGDEVAVIPPVSGG